METIQLAIGDSSYAAALREMLIRDGSWEIVSVDVPDPNQSGVMVLDPVALEGLPFPLRSPERVVLVTRNDPLYLSRAWEAGIVSVVFEDDPLSTAMLAVMAARLRVAKEVRRSVSPQSTQRRRPDTGECGHKASREHPQQIKPTPG